MDKFPMTVADVYPATRPSRTRVSSARHPLDSRGERTEEKASLEKLLGQKENFLSLVLSLDRNALCKLQRSIRGVTTPRSAGS